MDEELIQLSKAKEIYALPKGSAIVCDGCNLSVMGKAYVFRNGERHLLSGEFQERNLRT
jgi:hypothetical protein